MSVHDSACSRSDQRPATRVTLARLAKKGHKRSLGAGSVGDGNILAVLSWAGCITVTGWDRQNGSPACGDAVHNVRRLVHRIRGPGRGGDRVRVRCVRRRHTAGRTDADPCGLIAHRDLGCRHRISSGRRSDGTIYRDGHALGRHDAIGDGSGHLGFFEHVRRYRQRERIGDGRGRRRSGYQPRSTRPSAASHTSPWLGLRP